MTRYLLVALGSAVGGVCRYGVGEVLVLLAGAWSRSVAGLAATLLVNLLGCFLIALVNEAVLGGAGLRTETRLLLTTGLCGGFTTYSAFNHEVAVLLSRRMWGMGIGYLLATVVGCLGMHALGVVCAQAARGLKIFG